MAYLTFYLPAVDAAAAMSVLDALAGKSGPDDERPVAARRVDAFMAIIAQILASGATPDGTEEPTQQGKRPQMVITVAQSTLDGACIVLGFVCGDGLLVADMIGTRAGVSANPEDGADADGAGGTGGGSTEADRGECAGHPSSPARVRNPDATPRAVRTYPVEC